MKLNKELLDNQNEIAFTMPQYDAQTVKQQTLEEPVWLHFGAGNIFRAFLGAAQQKLLNKGLAQQGIIAAEGYDYEIVDVLHAYDDLTMNVTLKDTGDVSYEVLASIVDYLKMDPQEEDYQQLISILQAPSLQMISFTITEKGYSIQDASGTFAPVVQADFENGPENVQSYLGKVVALLHERFLAGKLPIALVSMDNMSHNGEKLAASVMEYAKQWAARGLVSVDFPEYVADESLVSFPWSMIDKITPRPDTKVQTMLGELGLEDMAPRMTAKNTYVSPYVNGEETEYLIVEDHFPNGRPPLEEAGIIFTTRDTVNATETMKVTACLNPLHTALAIYGCLLGYTAIYEEMKDEDLVTLIKQLGYNEGLRTVVDPKIVSPKQFIDEVVQRRLPNPFIPDAPQRIATDTSQKLGIRFGITLGAYVEDGNTDELVAIPLVYAGWIRYLMGLDDNGEEMPLSPDPLFGEILPLFEGAKVGEPLSEEVHALLHRADIFGIDLYEAGIGEKVWSLVGKLTEGPGAVRKTLQEELRNVTIKEDN